MLYKSFSFIKNYKSFGTSLVVQSLRLHAPNAGYTGLIPGWVTKIPRVPRHGQNKKSIYKSFVNILILAWHMALQFYRIVSSVKHL